MKALFAALGLTLALGSVAAAPAMAANAKQPYKNIDRRVDKGGPTGDSEVEKLNQMQLDQAKSSMGYVVGAPQPVGAPMAPMAR